MKKRALGKGLSALLSDNHQVSTSAQAVVELPLSEIHGNPLQPRQRFDESSLRELAESIREHGVVQPVVCTREPEGYRLVIGERRCRAARLVGLDRIPAIVREMAGAEILEVALIENLQREDLNPVEEANAYNYLLREHSMTQDDLAQRLGRSRPAISNALRLLGLPESIRDDLEQGVLSAGHARAVLGLEDRHHQLRAWSEAAARGLSVRQMETLVRTMLEGKVSRSRSGRALDPDWLDIQDHLTRQLGSRVRIRPGARGKGRIELTYAGQQELERLVEMLIYLGERIEARPSSGVL